MARRAASISRAVMRQRSVAFSPYSPNATKLPRCAEPAMRPLNCLRNLVRFGCIMCLYLSARCWRRGFRSLGCVRLALDKIHHRLVEHFALEYPHLDADDAVGGLRLGKAVIDVGAERVQRHAALADCFSARDFRAVETPGDAYLDAERTRTHRVRHGTLHRTAEHHALLELLRDAVGDKLRVELGLADLGDIQAHILHCHAKDLCHRRAELLDV